MNAPESSPTNDAPGAELSPAANRLPSGRTIALKAESGAETIEVRSPSGDIELAISLTPEGPVLRVRGARLELDATESVAVKCKEFELRTEESLRLSAGGSIGVASDEEIRMKSAEQTFIDADYVNLNCLDRTGYHDEFADDDTNAADDTGEEPTAEPPQQHDASPE